jgi:hypothetical protein
VKTPKSRKLLLIFSIILWLIQPIFIFAHYTWNQLMNAYPPEADSIGIPIFSELILWFLLTPIAIITIVNALKNYQGPIPIFQNRFFSRQFIWINILFGVLLGFVLPSLYSVFAFGNIATLINTFLLTYLLLCLRAAAILQRDTHSDR